MFAQHRPIVKAILSRLSLSGTAQETARTEAPDEEQQFLASIAHLPPAEYHKRIQTREMYRRMAQRQGIMEVESRRYKQ